MLAPRPVAMLVLLLGVALVFAPGASGTPERDFEVVYGDWEPDGKITPCRHDESRLEGAKSVAESNPDLIYTAFPGAVDRELERWRSGGCDDSAAASPLRDVKVVRVRGAGSARRESVVLRNTGEGTVRLDRATIRNRRGSRISIPSGVRVRAGRSVTVIVGCARGKRRAGRRGSRAWACSRRALFSDRGDVARLADGRGRVVASRRYRP